MREGFNVPLERLASETRLSGPALLRRFGSKSDLLSRALNSPVPDWAELMKAVPESGDGFSVMQQLLLRLEPHITRLIREQEVLRAAGISSQERMESLELARRTLTGWILNQHIRHRLHAPDAQAAARLLMSYLRARALAPLNERNQKTLFSDLQILWRGFASRNAGQRD